MTIESGVTLPDVFQEVCKLASDTLQVSRVGVWLLINDEQSLQCTALWEADAGEFSEGATLQVSDSPKYFEALKNRKVLPAETAQFDPTTTELLESYLRPLSIASLLDAPIIVAGKVVGVICHEHLHEPREWTTEERDFAASLADLLATKMRVAELQQVRSLLELSEDRLMIMEKSEALAKMAFGVAHDFRNILTAIVNCTEALRLESKQSQIESENSSSLLDIISQATTRGTELVRELAEFGKNSPSQPKVVDVVDLIEEFLPVLRTAVASSHRIDVQLERSSSRILIDRNQFHRVVLNLIVNAKEAMPDGGTIDLRVLPYRSKGSRKSSRVAIEIRDHGCGMSDDTKERLFEPFFTTKPQGSGLGMPIVQRIMERSGGNIEVESELNVGTTLRLVFPLIGHAKK